MPHEVSAPEPSGTSTGICTRTSPGICLPETKSCGGSNNNNNNNKNKSTVTFGLHSAKSTEMWCVSAPKACEKSLHTAKMTPSSALGAPPQSSPTWEDSRHLNLDSCFPFAVATHFYTDAFLQTHTALHIETFTQSSFSAQILVHREACAQIEFYKLTPLHTEAFPHRSWRCTKMLWHAEIRARIQSLLYRPSTQRNFCPKVLLRKETVIQESFDTEKLFHIDRTLKKSTNQNFYTQKLYLEQPSHTKILLTDAFTHRSLDAQHFLHRCFYTKMPLHRKRLHTEACAYTTLLHTFSLWTRTFASPSW